jgi:hypothetical protein
MKISVSVYVFIYEMLLLMPEILNAYEDCVDSVSAVHN